MCKIVSRENEFEWEPHIVWNHVGFSSELSIVLYPVDIVIVSSQYRSMVILHTSYL